MSRTLSSMSVIATAIVFAGCAQDTVVSPVAIRPVTAVAPLVTPSSIGWQHQARVLIASANMSPLAASRVLAALSIAQYRAVLEVESSDIDDELPRHGVGAGGRSALEMQRGALAAASARVLRQLFPGAANTLEQRVASEGNASPGRMHPQFVRGVAIGLAVGEKIAARLLTDHFTTPWTGTVPVGPDKWIANGTPAGVTFGGVTPWFMISGAQFRPAAPPALGSAAFNTDLAEIAALSANRTSAQLASALFWNLPAGTHTPVGYWNEVTTEYIVSANYNERTATHVFALTNAAIMDALIGCWEAKYYHWTLRPSQVNPQITLTFGLPNHPSYPSGHSCVSSAAATVLGHIFPDRIDALQTMVAEGGLSRMYAGIHYRFDITSGTDLGRAVGEWAINHQGALQSP